jgi:metal-sulfur cluster biosynthetic enzyme/Fe-S cluster assembly iron-binding protein IscA
MPRPSSRGDSSAAAEPSPETLRVRITREAHEALTAALAGRPTGSGVRLWVERGMHPHAQMMVDLPSHRDVPLTVDGVLLLVDRTSAHFLRDSEIRYRTDIDPAGFEVVGPFLPSRPVASGGSDGASPAAGPAPPTGASGTHGEAEERIRQALKNIYDPEIPMNIVDLGLVYGMEWTDAGDLTIRMTMTSPGCPSVEEIVREVENAARTASRASSVHVDIVWEPPWGPERMTEFARRQFGYA